MRILVLNQIAPFPPVSGGDLRTYHLVQALARRHTVTVAGFRSGNPFVFPPSPVRVVEVAWKRPRLWQDMQSGDPQASEVAYLKLLNETEDPWFVSCMESPAMESALRRIARGGLDLVVIEHTHMARFLPALPPRVPKLLDLHNVHTLMARRDADRACGEDREPARREAERTARFEQRAASACTLSVTTSEPEAAGLRTLGIDRVRVVPNGVDTSIFTPAHGAEAPDSLLFTGTMSYGPNVEAVRHFVSKVFPLIRAKKPNVRFHIVGAYPTAEVTRLASENVIVHGQVPDMAPYYQMAALVVVPLLHGGGTRLKILEAAACGKSILSTQLGAEGLDVRTGVDLVVADSVTEFADAAVRLLADEGERRRLGRSARRVAERYDWRDIGSAFCAVAEEAVRGGCRRVAPPVNGHANGAARIQVNTGRSDLCPAGSVRATLQDGPIKGRAFLVGCPRSGTTLLQSFLASHPRITSFPESHFFNSLVPTQPGLCSSGIASRKARARFAAFARELGRPELGRLLPRRARLMRRHVSAFVEMLDALTLEREKDRWLEKTPDHLHVVRVIERYVPGARFVHLLRNGEDVVASLYEVTRRYPRHWHGAWSLDACIAEWNSDLRRSWECRGQENHHFVWYERLLADPETVLEGLCRFFGVEFHPDMLTQQARAARTLVLPNERWKDQVAEGLKQAPMAKFETLFDAEQQAYIRTRLLSLDGWPTGRGRAGGVRAELPTSGREVDADRSVTGKIACARGGVKCS